MKFHLLVLQNCMCGMFVTAFENTSSHKLVFLNTAVMEGTAPYIFFFFKIDFVDHSTL